LCRRFYNPAANNQTMEEKMAQTNAQRADNDEATQGGGNRPVAKFRHGGVELSVWTNQTAEGGAMFNTNSYKDDKSGEWKTTSSFSPTDLLVVSELSRQAFAEITKLKQQGRGR
jgi:hypothetical protein